MTGTGTGGALVSGAGGATPTSVGVGGTVSSGGDGGTGGDGGVGGSTWIAQDCPAGEFAIGFDGQGTLQCAPLGSAVHAAVNDGCVVYTGSRDNCDGCTTAPEKWGWSGGANCSAGVGANNTCTSPSLGGVTPAMFGLNTDGDVNGDDKLYMGLRCTVPTDTPIAGPCAAGSFAVSYDGASVTCVTGEAAAVTYVRDQCELYYGWRDDCDGCTSAPEKWGRTKATECVNGTGLHNTCTQPTLGGNMVTLFGLNTDGDVDGNDKLYVGFHCDGAVAGGGTATGACPPGELMVGTNSDGTIDCADPAPAIEAIVQSECFLYYGFRDNCDGCTTAPAKWGRVNYAICENGVGNDNTCQTSPLNSTSVRLFGLNTDGDVNGDDKLYSGLYCP